MIINSIELNNIRSHKNSIIKLPKSSVLLAGDIGSGKSTILLALEFALFGFQKGELEGKTLLRHGCNKGYVKINFIINKEEVSLTREINKKKDSFLQSDAWLEIKGKKERLSVEEINNRIVKILNFPDPKKKNLIYRFTVYTPQEQMKRILLEKSDVRLDIIRKLFNIDKYKRIKENLGIYLKELRSDIKVSKAEIKDIEEIKDKIKKLEKESIELRKEKTEFETKINEKTREKQNHEKEIETLKKEIGELEKNIIELNKARARLNEKRENLEYIDREIKRIEKDVKSLDKEKIEKEKSELIKKLDSLSELEVINRKIKEKRDLKEKLGKLVFLNKNKIEQIEKEINESLKLDICPKCKQNVSEKHKKEVIEKLEKTAEESKSIVKQENANIISLEKEIESLESQIRETNKKQREIEKRINDIDFLIEKLKDYERKLENRERFKKELYKTEEFIKNFNIDENAYEKKKLFLEGKSKLLSSISELIFGFKENLDRIEEKIKLKAIEIEESGKRLEKKENLARKIERLELFEKWLSNEFIMIIEKLEKIIFFKINREFEALLKRWFEMLVEGLDIRISEDFTPIVEQNGYENDYNDLSGGEKTALALAYRLALNQLINSLTNVNTKGLIILDEPTEGFSQKQLEKMDDIFRELKTNQLLIVSHDPKIEGFVDSVIRLEKEEGITHISK